jgi:hypothetical protein
MEPNYQNAHNEKTPINYNQNLPGTSHKERISSLNGVFVKQRMNIMEVVTGCEMESIFDVFDKQPMSEKTKGSRQWRAIEESTCIQRNCVQQNCRSFKLKILSVQNGPTESLQACLRMERPCTCTCLCLNRPFITMNYIEGNENIYLGKISDPYDICKSLFQVYDKSDNPIYKIQTCCVQCGVVCRGCPCSPCKKVVFEVVDLRTGTPVPGISMTNPPCMDDLVSDSDNYGMDFAPGTSWEDRSLLLGAILFVDYMMFEEKGGL